MHFQLFEKKEGGKLQFFKSKSNVHLDRIDKIILPRLRTLKTYFIVE